jgi:predicted DNA-binding protein (MmcQ/YjbR family)
MKPLSIRPDRLERLREICLSLPEAAEKVAWDDPTWRVRDRIFAMQKGNYEQGRPSLWLKAPEGAQAALVGGDPERIFVPPYVGHKGWVGVYLDTRKVDWGFVASLVEESYRLIAPKALGERRAVSTSAPGTKEHSMSKLTRPAHRMPAFVRRALTERGLLKAYQSRPPYQRNDYVGWIVAAKRETTRQKRLEQMLDELEGGRLYMKMKWNQQSA